MSSFGDYADKPLPAYLKGVNNPSFHDGNTAWSPVLRYFSNAPGVYQLRGLDREDYRPCDSGLLLAGNRLCRVTGGIHDGPELRFNGIARAVNRPEINSWMMFRRNACRWIESASKGEVQFLVDLAENHPFGAFWLTNEMAFIDGKLYTNTRNVGSPNTIMDPWGQEIASGVPLAEFAKELPNRERKAREEAERWDLERKQAFEILERERLARVERELEESRRREADAKHDESLEVFGMF